LNHFLFDLGGAALVAESSRKDWWEQVGLWQR
jgi:hypothetical protein